jgi:hypothetical protein
VPGKGRRETREKAQQRDEAREGAEQQLEVQKRYEEHQREAQRREAQERYEAGRPKPKRKSGGGRKPSLTPEQIKRGVNILRQQDRMTIKVACRKLHSEGIGPEVTRAAGVSPLTAFEITFRNKLAFVSMKTFISKIIPPETA